MVEQAEADPLEPSKAAHRCCDAAERERALQVAVSLVRIVLIVLAS